MPKRRDARESIFHTLDQCVLCGMLSSIWGLLLGMALLLLPFLMGKSGGGDVKLFGPMAVGYPVAPQPWRSRDRDGR